MRKLFASILCEQMRSDTRLRLLLADVGFVLNRDMEEHRDRIVDFGASEQLMIGAAIGMASAGLWPVCYSITPFLIFRPYEWIRNHVGKMKLPIKLVGSGRDSDYGRLGFTHHAFGDDQVLSHLQIRIFKPNEDNAASMIRECLETDLPSYLNLKL